MTAEYHRELAMKHIKGIGTWRACEPTWKPHIDQLTNNLTNAQAVLDLGANLSDIFRGTGGSGRSQSDVSAGGTAWECLVTYYLNLVFTGTNCVALKYKKGLVPTAMQDATTVSYGNHQTNSESDICVVLYPDDFKFPSPQKTIKGYMDRLNAEVARRFVDMQLGVIQCKTNWNDNAQIPMLWDMVYRASFGAGTRITVGRNGRNVRALLRQQPGTQSLKGFTYSFVTVPTTRGKFTPTSTAVKRVDNLTGGNYWGQPSVNGVAKSIQEIFLANFGDAFPRGVQHSIQNAMDNKLGEFA